MTSTRTFAVLFVALSACVAEHDSSLELGEGAEEPIDEGVLEGKGDAPVITCAGESARDPGWGRFEHQVLLLTNRRREAGASCGGTLFAPVSPLRLEKKLTCAARAHSRDMVTRDFFNHINPDGEGPIERAAAAGFRSGTIGENIAAGQRTPAEVVDGWMRSAGHCRNIMSPNYTLLGVGFDGGVIDEGAQPITGAWTQAFGAS